MKTVLEKFIDKSNIIHSNKYDYSLVDYKNSLTRVKIICPVHGVFEQVPADHARKSGCKLCTKKMITQTEFIEKALSIHKNNYDYSLVNYKDLKTKVKICCRNNHEFEQLPYVHLRGNGCTICNSPIQAITQQQFIDKANQVHQNKYDYSKVNYTNDNTLIEVICKIHKEFKVRPSSHLKHGCRLCSHFNLGWSKSKFEERCIKNNNGFGIFYIIKCFNDSEEFYKVGITSRSIRSRYGSTKAMPYKCEVIQEIKDIPENIWKLEQHCKKFKDIKDFKYIPEIPFPGSLTECYKIKEN